MRDDNDDGPTLMIRDPGKSPVLNFRSFARTYVESFAAARDRVRLLIGNHHQQSVGTHREGLLKEFFREVLPAGISVDSGFVYGYEAQTPSRQIDIIIWDGLSHSAVFRTADFVIVPPEAVIAAVSVKSRLGSAEIKDAMNNLGSLSELDHTFRRHYEFPGGEKGVPILKLVVAYEKDVAEETAARTTATCSCDVFAENRRGLEHAVVALKTATAYDLKRDARHVVERVLPKMIITLDTNPVGIFQGWGPPHDATPVGPGLARIPYYYPTGSSVLSPLEKITYYILGATYMFRGIKGGSLESLA